MARTKVGAGSKLTPNALKERRETLRFWIASGIAIAGVIVALPQAIDWFSRKKEPELLIYPAGSAELPVDGNVTQPNLRSIPYEENDDHQFRNPEIAKKEAKEEQGKSDALGVREAQEMRRRVAEAEAAQRDTEMRRRMAEAEAARTTAKKADSLSSRNSFAWDTPATTARRPFPWIAIIGGLTTLTSMMWLSVMGLRRLRRGKDSDTHEANVETESITP